MRVPKPVVRIANAITKLALLIGIPRPPYTRNNALIVETVGRRSGKRHRIPVGYLDDSGHIIVVVEDGVRANWIQNALANNNRLKVHLRGGWREAVTKEKVVGPAKHVVVVAMQATENDIEAQLRAIKSRNARQRGVQTRERLWQAPAEQGNARKG